MPRTVSDFHRSYVLDRRAKLQLCRMARACGNKIGLRSVLYDALYEREMGGIGRPRCALTGRPLTQHEINTIPLRKAA